MVESVEASTRVFVVSRYTAMVWGAVPPSPWRWMVFISSSCGREKITSEPLVMSSTVPKPCSPGPASRKSMLPYARTVSQESGTRVLRPSMSPARNTSTSFPAPPSMKSAPLPPSMTSFPSSPEMLSAPVPP